MPRKERERRYISEYMLATWPEGDWQLNVELGMIPPEYVVRHGYARAAALYRPTRPRVDAVKWTPDAYYLIEAKIRDVKSGIGDLLYYRARIPETLDLPYYEGQPLILRMIVPWTLEWVQAAAKAAGVEVVVFWVDWIADYVKEHQHYFTAEYRQKRAETMRLRNILGVE